MPDLARYDFLPWLRRGVSSEITEADTLGQAASGTPANLRAHLDVRLTLRTLPADGGAAEDLVLPKDVQLVGPGDIAGISQNAIVRTEPRDRVTNFETNCFPYVEFYEEDFPWRYTPAAVQTAEPRKLRPWIMLLVLEEGEYTYHAGRDGLPTVTLTEAAAQSALFPHTQSWAWAHVHFYQDLVETPGTPAFTNEVNRVLAQNPDAAVSRLLCPRKLAPEKTYRAFLVPAFETGRLAGLGEDPSGTAAQAPSWEYGASATGRVRPLDFPVYHQWGFQTSLHGDFKSLAMLLQPQVLGADFGQRAMDITRPGFGLDAAAGQAETPVLGFEGALQPPDFQRAAWPAGPHDRAVRDGLKQIVNLSADLQDPAVDPGRLPAHPYYHASLPDDPIVTPPLYAGHQAAHDRAGQPGNPAWLDTLNLDPRHRAAAGLGVKVVQENQEALMEAAWKQIGEVNAANQKIREAELAKEVNRSLWHKRVRTQSADRVVGLTGPMHARLLDQGLTVEATVARSRVPAAANSAGLRKLVRPGQKMMRKLAAASGEQVRDRLVERFNLQEDQPLAATAARAKKIPDMAVGIDQVQADADAAAQEFQSDRSVAQHVFVDALASLRLSAFDAAALNGVLDAAAISAPGRALAKSLVAGVTAYQVIDSIVTVTVEKNAFIHVYGPDDTGKFRDNVLVQRPLARGEQSRITAMTTAEDVQAYGRQFSDLAGLIRDRLTPALPRPLIQDLPGLAGRLGAALHPDLTLTRRVLRTLTVWSAAHHDYVPVQVLAPVMAHPEFFQPVYEYLAKMSQDFIIPNCNRVPRNSLTLLTPNPVFIESVFAGLNHEMGRELLWREYPTDQRGSYFKKFWDTRDNLAAAAPDRDPDITPLDRWQGALGRHSLRADHLLVLVIRGELLQKYPNTVVYAQRAEAAAPGQPRRLKAGDDLTDTALFRFPILQARLEPDISLFGFVLSVPEAKGGAGDPGWFFVLKERPGEVRFGLDDAPGAAPATDLKHLAWSHFSADPAVEPGCLDFSQARLAAGAQSAWQGLNAADWAAWTFRNPILFARHAREMLA